jgi:hypothetical protein
MQYGNFIGNFADDAACLARLVVLGWDLGGNPREGMTYYDTTLKVIKSYLNARWESHDGTGSVACAQIIQSGQPNANDLLTVGADVYEANGAGANINVVIGGNAAATMVNLLAAAVAHGTEDLFWDQMDATHLRIRSADGPQGNVIAANPNIALVVGGAPPAGWTNYVADCGDVNLNTLGGGAAAPRLHEVREITLNAGHIAAAELRVPFPFTVARFDFRARTALGANVLTMTDTAAINHGDVLFALAGGAGDLAATDILQVEAWSA